MTYDNWKTATPPEYDEGWPDGDQRVDDELTAEELIEVADEEIAYLRSRLADCVTARVKANTAYADKVKVLREALVEAEEFFDDRADAETPHGASGPIPNDEMRLLMAIRAALESTK